VTRSRDYVQVRPVNAEGAAIAGHEALLAIDRDTESYWSEKGPRTQGVDLTVTFDPNAKAVDLDRVGIYSGAGDLDFEKQPRPKTMLLEFTGPENEKAGKDDTQTIRLVDKPAEQVFSLNIKHPVRMVTVRIVDEYPALGNRGHEVSIASLEFFDKQ